MSNPANKAATQEATEENSPKFAEAVNAAVKAATVDDKGNLVLPEGISEEVAYAATLEKRRRDTQSEFTKTQQKNKALEAENATLLTRVVEDVEMTLTDEQKEELDELKFSDPEAWRKKYNALEAEFKSKRKKEVSETVKQVSAKGLEAEELEQRKQTLTEFNEAHPEFVLNDDVIANDIPPRILKKLETGKISFEAFLQECYDYVNAGKVVKQDEETLDQPNLSKVGGGARPDANAVKEDIVLSYNKETY